MGLAPDIAALFLVKGLGERAALIVLISVWESDHAILLLCWILFAAGFFFLIFFFDFFFFIAWE